MIDVRNISKTFNSICAVDGVSFTTKPGEIFGLLGPNGAGKSTTIRMIMNILKPDSGVILFDGKPICEKDKDRLGYLPEERGLYKKVKVNDILLYLAGLKGKNASESQPHIDYWLERFDLKDWKYRKVDELSRGMGQKRQNYTFFHPHYGYCRKNLQYYISHQQR
ncbi:MAG: ATP-binding cassette domain-containing protein [Spirochaetota bacterium]